MVVKSQIKFVRSLQQKKYRKQHGLFVAEGVKLVIDLLNSGLRSRNLYCTDANITESIGVSCELISESELGKMSGLKTPNKMLGVFEIPEEVPLKDEGWILALDDVQDPGNLGTIIRLCDWFGIGQLLCSPRTVDCYNPKTLQATMGSIARVNIIYSTLEEVIQQTDLPVYGTFMKGHSVYEQSFGTGGIILMGNEAHGISENIEQLITNKISIPAYGNSDIESLNVAMATAILLSEVRRPSIQK